MKVKVKVWLEDGQGNFIFGKGKTEILDQIDKTGSISEASKEMGMNYKKAWGHIKVLEKYIKEDMVYAHKGRGENSGTKLTPKAKMVMEKYAEFEKRVKEFTQKKFEEFFRENGKYILE